MTPLAPRLVVRDAGADRLGPDVVPVAGVDGRVMPPDWYGPALVLTALQTVAGILALAVLGAAVG